MLEKHYQVANNFWRSQQKYPNYGNIKARRIYEINYLISHLPNVSSILDLGCGDGTTLLLLKEFMEIKSVYAYDISDGLLNVLTSRWVDDVTKLYTSTLDLTKDDVVLPETDATFSFGLFPFLFDDQKVIMLIEKIKSDFCIIKTPCTLKSSNELIYTFSEQLNAEYASNYRTVDQTLQLLRSKFSITNVDRAYPDELESKFGTKQFFFVCRAL